MSYLVYAGGTQNMKKNVLAKTSAKLYNEKFKK